MQMVQGISGKDAEIVILSWGRSRWREGRANTESRKELSWVCGTSKAGLVRFSDPGEEVQHEVEELLPLTILTAIRIFPAIIITGLTSTISL